MRQDTASKGDNYLLTNNIIIMTTKQFYAPPRIDEIEVRIEEGFATSTEQMTIMMDDDPFADF